MKIKSYLLDRSKYFCFGIALGLITHFLFGCVAVHQESEHSKYSHALSTNGHVRWYQYNRLWFNNGGKPPAGAGGILYTIFTPSDWFWYGPYELTPKEEFLQYYKKDCPGCKYEFEYKMDQIKKRLLEIEELKKSSGRECEIEILKQQINSLNRNNCFDSDFDTPFEKRF